MTLLAESPAELTSAGHENPLAPLVRFISRPQQWALLEQEPHVWQLPGNSLLHWVLAGRDCSREYQVQSLQQMLQWWENGQLVPPPSLTDLAGWPQLWQHWIAQGLSAGWLFARGQAGHWSLWQPLSSDGAALLEALGFQNAVTSLQQTRWAAVFLLSNGYQHFLLDCAGQRYTASDRRFCCLFRLCCELPMLADALANEAEVFQLPELLFYQLVVGAQQSTDAYILPPVKGQLQARALPLSYQQISALAATKPWLLRYLPLTPAMAVYRLPLCRYMPWLYRQLWPAQPAAQLLQQWVWQHRLQRPFVSAEFFEAALLAAITDGLPGERPVSRIYVDQQHQVRSALSLYQAQRNSAAAGKTFVLADLANLTQLWWQQSRPKPHRLIKSRLRQRQQQPAASTVAALPAVLEQLKVLYLMLMALHKPQLRQLIAQCPWLLLLLPADRSQDFIDTALSDAPAMAELLLPRLNARQRLQAFRFAPQLIRHAGVAITQREYRQLVNWHPTLAMQFPDWASPAQLVRAVAGQPELFAKLRPEQLTQALLEQLLSLRGELLAELPKRLRSFKLCHLAITQQLTALAYVPDDFDRQLCLHDGYWLFYQQSYQWAKRYQPQLAVTMQQKLPEFCRLFADPPADPPSDPSAEQIKS